MEDWRSINLGLCSLVVQVVPTTILPCFLSLSISKWMVFDASGTLFEWDWVVMGGDPRARRTRMPLARGWGRGDGIHPDTAAFITSLLSLPESSPSLLLDHLRNVGPTWPWPRTDLQYWIRVLNRFDGVLEAALKKYEFGIEGTVVVGDLMEKKEEQKDTEGETKEGETKEEERKEEEGKKKDKKVMRIKTRFQLRAFEEEDKALILEVLRFQRLLFENSTNRKIWAGYDRLDDLFLSCDLDVVRSTLLTALRPAHQYSASLHHHSHHFKLDSEALLVLAMPWEVQMRWEGGEAEAEKREEVEFDRSKYSKRTENGAAEMKEDGIVNLNVTQVQNLEEEVERVTSGLEVPIEDRFSLLQRARIANALSGKDPTRRKKLLEIKLLAVGTWCHLCNVDGSAAQAKLFTQEPEIIAQLADLIHPDKKDIPVDVKTAAFYAMEGIIRFKHKSSEVASAVNASLSHGILMCVVKDLVEDLAKEEGKGEEGSYGAEFIEAIFSFLNVFQQTSHVGGMVINAGIIQLLVQLIKNPQRTAVLGVLKAITLVDQLIYTYPNGFNIFATSNGLQVYVERIKAVIDMLTEETMAKEMLESRNVDSPQGPLPADFVAYLKAIFRSLHRIMTQSGTTEGLRNLIDSSLTESIKKIIGNQRLFGPQIYALAINVMCTFVHNEPTSLAVLQDASLPQVFYDSVEEYIAPVIDVLSAIPHAIGALCLNEVGLKQFNERNIIPKLFSIFSSEKHIKVLLDRDNGSLLGAAFDELIRHHPTLKQPTFEAVQTLILDIEKQGQAYSPPDQEGYSLHVPKVENTQEGAIEATASSGQATGSDALMETDEQPASTSQTDEEKKDEKEERRNYTLDYINVASKLLEGIFQNVSHCKDFVDEQILTQLLNYTTLPSIPYDWPGTESYKNYSILFKTICEVSPTKVLIVLLKTLSSSLDELTGWWDGERVSEPRIKMFLDYSSVEHESSNRIFRHLIAVQTQASLLGDCNAAIGGYQTGKPLTAVLLALNGEREIEAIRKLAQLHQTCLWENHIAKNIIPASWNEANLKHTIKVAQIYGLPDWMVNALKTEKVEFDKADARYKNFKASRHLITTMAGSLLTFFQGIGRMFVHRRPSDSTHRKQALKAADNMAAIIRDYTKWPESGDNLGDFAYSTAVIRFVSVMLTDDRQGNGLQTILLVALERCGGLTALCNLYQRQESWANESIKEVLALHDAGKPIPPETIYVYVGLRAALNLFLQLTAMKPLFESVQTQILSGRESSPGEPVWKTSDFLVHLRLSLAPFVSSTWHSLWLTESATSFCRTVIRIILNILKAEGESMSSQSTSSIAAALASQAGFAEFASRAPVVADEQKVTSLIEMGFPRSIAETALIRCHNNLSAATEWLLNHQGAVAEARAQEARAAATTARATEPVTSGTDIIQSEPSMDPIPAQSTSTYTEPQNADVAPPISDDVEMSDSAADLEPPRFPPAPERPVSPPLVPQEEDHRDAAMEEVGPNTEATKESKSEETTKPDPAVTEREELTKVKEEFKSSFFEKAVELAYKWEDIIFDIRDAFGYISKDMDDYFSRIVSALENEATSSNDPSTDAATGVRLRLIAVLASDVKYQYMFRIELPTIAEACKTLFQRFNANVRSDCKWLTPLLLVAETSFTFGDQPKSGEVLDKGMINILLVLAKPHPASPVFTPDDMLAGPKLEAHKEAAFQTCLKVLALPPTSKTLVLAVLRLLLCLTKEHRFAQAFVEQGGLELLFSLFSTDEKATEGCRSLALLIIRHVVEDPRLLISVMEREAAQWISTSRNAAEPDVHTFTRATSAMIVREPVTFVKAIQKAFELREPEPEADGLYHVRLLSVAKPKAEKKSQSATTDNEMMVDQPTARYNQPEPFTEPSKSMDVTMHFLIQQFVQAQPNAIVSVPQSESSIKEGDSDISFAPYIHACFILSAICELIACYPPAKSSLMTFTNENSCKTKFGFVSFLLQEVICSGSLVSENDDPIAQQAQGLSQWAHLLIVALMWDPYPGMSKDKEAGFDISQVRKNVLDMIIKAFKDASSSTEGQERRYARLAALGDLCHRILTVAPYAATKKPPESSSLPVAKLMLEKNFVSVLTNALSDVDLNFPSIHIMTTFLLKPIEFLTRVVTKVGRSVDRKLQLPLTDDFSDGSESVSEEDEDSIEDEEETPDLYRNSALGMHEGELDDTAQADAYMDEDGFDEDEDMMDAEEDDYLGSDMSDVSEDEVGDATMIEERHGESEGGTEDDENTEDDETGSEDGDGADEVVISEEIIDDDDEGDEGDGDAAENALDWMTENVTLADEGADIVVEDENEVQAIEDAPGGPAVLVDAEDGGDAASLDSDVEDDEEDAYDIDADGRPMDDASQMFTEAFREIIADIGGGAIITGGGREPLRRRLLGLLVDDGGRDVNAFGRQRANNQPDLAPHPLLVDPIAVLPQMSTRSHRRRHLDELMQNFATEPNGNLNAILTHMIARGDPNIIQRAMEYTIAPRLTAGSASQSRTQKLSARIKSTQDFLPQPTGSRWNEESHVYPPVLTPNERASRVSSHVVSALLAKELEVYGPSGRPKLPAKGSEEEERPPSREEEKGPEEGTAEEPSEDVEMNPAVENSPEEPTSQQVNSLETQEGNRTPPPSIPVVPMEPLQTEDIPLNDSSNDPLAQIMRIARSLGSAEASNQLDQTPQASTSSFNIEDMARSLAEGLAAPTVESTTAVDPPSTNLIDRDETETSDSNDDEPMESVEIAPAPVNEPQSTTDPTDPSQQATGTEASNQSAAPQRVTITIHGNVHDITDTGIDPTFLEALPDDMREEVLNQHIRETRATAATQGANSAISSDFLDALPPEIRAEVLQQEALEQGRRNRSENPPPGDSQSIGPVEMDAGTFLATLDPSLRHQVLLEQEDTFLSSLPPQLLAEANRLRERPTTIRRAFNLGARRPLAPPLQEPQLKKVQPSREAVQLLDKAGVAALVRLIFHPLALRKSLLTRVLVNLCENAKTRGELLGLLLTILHDGTRDGTMMDKTFSQMSSRASKGNHTSAVKLTRRPTDTGHPVGLPDTSPHLIAQRCLDAMAPLVITNQLCPLFFLTEQDTPSGLNRKMSRKGKGKEKALPATTYPIIFLLSMLDRPDFLKTQGLVESLTGLLANITKPLNILSKKQKEEDKEDKEDKQKNADEPLSTDNAESGTTTTTVPTEQPIGDHKDKSKKKADGDPKEKDDPTEVLVSRPPQIPSHVLRYVVNILDAGECSSRTFQQTLLLIQNLSLLPDAQEGLLSELQARAQTLGDLIVEDLQLLLEVLKKDSTESNEVSELGKGQDSVRSVTLTRFSPASSLQTKLLRILKTIDYTSTATSNGRKPVSEYLQLLSALSLAPTNNGTNDQSEAAAANSPNAATGGLTKEQKMVEGIYEDFKYDKLWSLMSDCLGEIEKGDPVEMVQIATVLMPLVEAFMVVCKYSIILHWFWLSV
ncbi:hypothetical protein BT69DRAFT_1317383 [Atractiella rhizophila]|nr:hypothetical protein BT69DRAFT_1317383 [Atractiella rhizophila]